MGFIEHPWERAGVITPGLPILPHGVERHPVPGGGSRAVPISKGDKISVLNKEGLQRRAPSFGSFVPKSDEEIRRDRGQLPKHKERDEIVGQNKPKHREHEAREKQREAIELRVPC